MQILRPLVRLALRHQLSLHALVEALKRLLVEEAVREMRAAGSEPTDSRIHALTGVHRKDVRRLRRAASKACPDKTEESIAARLIACWSADEDFLAPDGQPRPLAYRRTRKGDPRSFEDLVNDVSRQDVRPRAVLEELLRLKVVEWVGDRIMLRHEAFIPDQDLEQKLFYVGLNTGDHAAAAVHNTLGLGKPMLERSVHYEPFSELEVEELEQLARVEGMRLLQMLNRRARAIQRRDRVGTRSARINAGIYFYRGSADEEQTQRDDT